MLSDLELSCGPEGADRLAKAYSAAMLAEGRASAYDIARMTRAGLSALGHGWLLRAPFSTVAVAARLALPARLC